jgi:peptidyl-prolyl cis-trans isomerase SurA
VAQARETLVNERLQRQAAERFGVAATPEEIEEGVTAFAGQANMGAQQFINALGQAASRPETVRDFISVGHQLAQRGARPLRRLVPGQRCRDRPRAGRGGSATRGRGAIDYATIPIVGGRGGDALPAPRRSGTASTPATTSTASGPRGFERQVLPPSEIPQDIAAALSRLDPDEMSFDVTRGQAARSSW